ncbi:MAG TPA: DNA replication/repair protein RecF [Rhodospirillales bacterium]|nr:DNA replication/repair protein RecF [Rhodospirillales bacterium]
MAFDENVPVAETRRPSGACALYVARLTLTDFRSYSRLRLDAAPGAVVLTGVNGAGKTNLLEALSFLAPGRGLRRSRLADATRREADGEDSARTWAVAARIETKDGPVDLGTGLEVKDGGRERRVVHIDGMVEKSQAALADYLSVQWLTPQMDRLFQEGPSARRRFLDRLVFGFDPAHAGRVSAYNHAMRERSRLLCARRREPEWLSALEDTMASKGVAVAAARSELAARLGDFCATAPGSFPRAGIEVCGALESWLGEGPALVAEDKLRAALARSREKDGETGGAETGPHKSDMKVHHLEKGREAEICSTGEQKALLISLVLASARMQAQDRGTPPLLLLDEVTAHLDSERREALFEELEELGAQAWMTGTDAALFAPLKGNALFLKVEDSRITH